MSPRSKVDESPLDGISSQAASIMEAIKKQPLKKRRILSSFFTSLYDAVKETLKKQGQVMPMYFILGEEIDFGMPPVTDQVIEKARELGAEAVVTVEGFQSERDIGDVIYHVSMSAPSIGVMGWVLKVKLGDGSVWFIREMPYLFDSNEKVRTLGELVDDMERGLTS
ncbi:MAG: hypothetical protein MUO52_06610 [Desulfobacterales bacterium]|nr:hypothetical protein [Desulfobacterales bacterium]